MVHFPGFARVRLWIHRTVVRFYLTGFPHSEIPGSKPTCGSPRLIAACHVLHRLLLPRHPPCALSNLTIKFTESRTPEGAPHPQISMAPPPGPSRVSQRAPAGSKALIKIYSALYVLLPNLFSCQTSSGCLAAAPAWAGLNIAVQNSAPIAWAFNLGRRVVVELTGFEPVASWLQTRRSPN